MERVVVIGSSCSGKSRFSKELAFKLDVKYIELDQFHWLPNWQERDADSFSKLVDEATMSGSWVVDGNYASARSIVWPRSSTLIWLNHSFSVVLYRAITRSISRVLSKQELFSGNVESFRQTFLSRKSIILWVLMTYHDKRKRYAKMLNSLKDKGVTVIEFKNQFQVDEYLKGL
jgi:adenylate kinase family enzyme